LGCVEEDRARADEQFYVEMWEDAAEKPWWSRWWYFLMAKLYYHAVRRWGRGSFYYADHELTREELFAELERLKGLT